MVKPYIIYEYFQRKPNSGAPAEVSPSKIRSLSEKTIKQLSRIVLEGVVSHANSKKYLHADI